MNLIKLSVPERERERGAAMLPEETESFGTTPPLQYLNLAQAPARPRSDPAGLAGSQRISRASARRRHQRWTPARRSAQARPPLIGCPEGLN